MVNYVTDQVTGLMKCVGCIPYSPRYAAYMNTPLPKLFQFSTVNQFNGRKEGQNMGVIGKQCDQMARLYVHYLAIYHNENLQNLLKTKYTIKHCHWILIFCQCGKISSNVVTSVKLIYLL